MRLPFCILFYSVSIKSFFNSQILCFLIFSGLAQTLMWLSNINTLSHNFLHYSIFKITYIFMQLVLRVLVMLDVDSLYSLFSFVLMAMLYILLFKAVSLF